MAYEQIIYEVADNIATITLNRPEKLNAFTGIMMNEMIDAFDKVDADDNVRAVIVTGAGRAFCAGADLSAGPRRSTRRARIAPIGAPRSGRRHSRLERRGRSRRRRAPDAAHLRVQEAGDRGGQRRSGWSRRHDAACDGCAARVGNARFGFVFARRGIVPEACSSWFLPKVVGISQALEWSFTGRVFPAEEALEGGRSSKKIYKPDELIPAARALAREIARQHVASVGRVDSADAVADGRRGPSDGSAQDRQPRNFSRGSSADVKEGVASFLEKRPAKFPHKVSKDMPPYFPWWQERKYS